MAEKNLPKSDIDSEIERSTFQIILGQKEPETEYEKALKKELDEVEKSGKKVMFDIPANL